MSCALTQPFNSSGGRYPELGNEVWGAQTISSGRHSTRDRLYCQGRDTEVELHPELPGEIPGQQDVPWVIPRVVPWVSRGTSVTGALVPLPVMVGKEGQSAVLALGTALC